MTNTTAVRRRPRWPWVVLVIVVVLAALVVAGELVARAVVPKTIRSLVISNLDLPADQQLDVQVPGMLLPQLISGTLDEVKLASDEVTIGGITGSARVTASEVPVSGGALGAAHGTVWVDQGEFASLLDASQLPISGIELAAPNATVEADVELFGSRIPVGLTVTPEADDGDLLLTPVAIMLNGTAVDLHAVSGLAGAAGAAITQPQRICIAERLPAGITLTGLRIEGSRAVADISADGRITVDPTLLDPGTCPRP
ncbi:LmeA family phospholipid-binding protein [Microbacterium sp. NPDC055521]